MAKKAIQLFYEMNIDFGVLTTTSMLAGAVLLTGRAERAACLLGASQANLDEMGARSQPSDKFEIDQFIQETSRALGEAAFQAEWARGAGDVLSRDGRLCVRE